jgi:hypothetical protein
MCYIQAMSRDQSLLFPDVIDHCFIGHNAIRFIDPFVGSLDLEERGFHRSQFVLTGGFRYDPGHILKHNIDGSVNHVRSSRRAGESSRGLWLGF